MNELPFSKKKQLGKKQMSFEYSEKDKRFKRLFVFLWMAWRKESHFECVKAMDNNQYLSFGEINLAHIQGKKSHPELRWNLSNVQLISFERHEEEHRKGNQVDYRPVDFVKWINSLNFEADML